MPTVHRITSGKWRENGYVIEGSGADAVIVDPGLDEAAFKSIIEQRSCTPRAIINTHAHYDHIGSVVSLTEAYGIPFYLHKGDAVLLRQANIYRALFGETEILRIPTEFTDLAELQPTLDIAGLEIEILPTPGHTKGSTCLRIGQLLFTGDTLMGKGPGRVDLPGGSAAEMEVSQAQLAALPGDLVVHPGHGEIVSLRHIRDIMAA